MATRNSKTYPPVSVIVPVYNVQDYVEICLRSILRQAYPNLEIIVVNDGSTDSSGEICDKLAATDSRLKVMHKPNGGLSSARNHGLDHVAHDGFVAFVDGDDWISENLISEVVHAAIRDDCDCVAFGYRMEYEDGSWKERKTLKEKQSSNLDDYLNWFLAGELSTTAWSKIYRCHIWREIRFPLGRVNEDLWVFLPLLRNTSKLKMLTSAPYHYIQRPESIMGKPFHPGRMDQVHGILSWFKLGISDAATLALLRSILARYSWYLLAYMRGEFPPQHSQCIDELVGLLRKNRRYIEIPNTLDRMVAKAIGWGASPKFLLSIREFTRKIKEG